MPGRWTDRASRVLLASLGSLVLRSSRRPSVPASKDRPPMSQPWGARARRFPGLIRYVDATRSTRLKSSVGLESLSDSKEYDRAAHDEAPVEVWREVIRRWPDMRLWVAQNKTVPNEILEILSRDIDPNVRDMVARKGRLAPSIQLKLLDDPDETVRAALALNRRAIPEVIERLYRDESKLVREAIGSKHPRGAT